MNYLENLYKLKPVEQSVFREQARKVGILQGILGLAGLLKVVTKKEEPALANQVLLFSNHLQEKYNNGGGFYALSFCVGLTALRSVNPTSEIPSVKPSDWDNMMAREADLRVRPNVKTLEQIGGLGLLEIQDVNSGYVEGYQQLYVDNPNMTPYTGFTGLATLHAHDILHFASQRSI